MDKKEQEKFNDMLLKLQSLLPNSIVRHQPYESLNILLDLENEYSLNTSFVFENHIKDKALNLPEDIVYIWMQEFRIFKRHKGNFNLLNTQDKDS